MNNGWILHKVDKAKLQVCIPLTLATTEKIGATKI